MPGFSLILATSGRTAELHRFFAALEAAGDGDCECIVVDQNPDDRLVPILATWDGRIAIRHLRSSPGLSHARNVGLAAATGKVLAFPDDDCWYSPDLLREVRSFFVANPRYALLSVGVCDESGGLSGNRWVRDRCDLATANLFRTSVGMALFVRRDSVAGAFRFDESLGVGSGTRFASGEDTDYVFRLLATGLRGRFDRSFTVYHPRRDMLSGGANAVRAYGYGCGMGRVIRKRAKLPLMPAFVAFDLLRLAYGLLCGQPGPRLVVRRPWAWSFLGFHGCGVRLEREIRTAITYHYSLSFGGSERVLEVLAGMYPDADFFALFVDSEFLPEALRGRTITTSFLDRIPGGKRIYRQLLPLYPIAVECLDLSGYDLVISADGAATKGVLTDQHTVHLCYCHSPPRSYWDQYAANRRTMPLFVRAVFAPVSQYSRQWDFAAAQRVDGFIANSYYVAERVRKYYRRESTVIYPPVDVSGAQVSERHEDFYLSVGRLVAAKRVDLAITACNRLGRRLQIAGTGPDESALRELAGPTIEFLGRVGEAELKAKYASCRALLFAADEDFGLVSVEAQAHGRPVIAYGRGGSLETVHGLWAEDIDAASPMLCAAKYTGVFFSIQSPLSLAEAMLGFERIEECFDPGTIHEHARRFDREVFVEEVRRFVEEQLVLQKRLVASDERISRQR